MELIERQVFCMLACCCMHLPAMQLQMMAWLYIPKASTSTSTEGSSQWQPGLVQKLFDKERDNHHEEALLLAQLAAQQLQTALQAQDGPTIDQSAFHAWTQATAKVF